ncbi:MAG: hypothetical protein HUU55_09315, partial [Myxococcales bacterium]|nr:hypothetical protein [Myxococcales bacterium]
MMTMKRKESGLTLVMLLCFTTFVACGEDESTGQTSTDVADITEDVADLAVEPVDSPDVTDTGEPPNDSGTEDTGPTGCTKNEDCPAGPSTCVLPFCEIETGTCTFAPVKDYTDCDDKNACTAESYCLEGYCEPFGGTLDCDDGNPCTADSCDPFTGCVATAAAGPCDDGNECTTDDSCTAGICAGETTEACTCTENADCAAYEDNNTCNGTLACIEGICIVDSATIIVCSTPDAPACKKGACDPATGQCVLALVPNGTGCSDGTSCTLGDSCTDGQCIPGTPVCDCQADGDCLAFDDADLCNGKLICGDSHCIPDPIGPKVCAASDNPCETTYCDTATGECATSPLADGTVCGEDDPCLGTAACLAGECISSGPKDCSDQIGCTLDSCVAGQCLHTVDDTLCTTGSGCVIGVCDVVADCVWIPQEGLCDDGNTCTVNDACNNGECTGAAVVCNDLDSCTMDTCVDGTCTFAAIEGCVPPCADNAACDDNNPCTADLCDNGACVNSSLENAPCADG